MYRILQSLEREPSSTAGWAKQAPAVDPAATGTGIPPIETKESEENQMRRSNPRKYLLYRPTFAQLMLYIATCFKDITENSALLLYISADGSKRQIKSGESTGNHH